MSTLQNILKASPHFIQKPALKFLFKRNGIELQDFFKIADGNAYLYKVDNAYLPHSDLVWFVSKKAYKDLVLGYSAAYYKPQKGDTIVDIGAGMGEETFVYADMIGDKGKIYAIEANPKITEVLEIVVAKNNLHQVTVSNIAISATNEPVTLDAGFDSFISASISNAGKSTQNTFEVRGQRFEDYIQEHKIDHIDLLKVNIEGAERFVVDTVGDAIKKVKHVFIACHDFRFKQEGNEFFRTKDYISDFLTRNNFSLSFLNTGKPYIDDCVFGVNKAYVG